MRRSLRPSRRDPTSGVLTAPRPPPSVRSCPSNPLAHGGDMRTGIAEMVDLLMKAHADKQPTPLISQHYPDLDVDAAYEVQRAYARRRLANDRIGGLKAGLTSEANQKRMGMSAPV